FHIEPNGLRTRTMTVAVAERVIRNRLTLLSFGTLLGTALPGYSGALAAQARSVSSHAPMQCTVVERSTRPIVLENGARIVLDITGSATSAGSWMFVGNLVHEWAPTTPGHESVLIREDSLLGIRRDALGNWHAVPSPFPGRRITAPAVVG